MTDPRGVPLIANGRLLAEFGSVSAASWLDLVEEADRDAAQSSWLAAALEQAPSEVELSLKATAGRMHHVCRIASIEDRGALLAWVVTFSPSILAETTEVKDLRARLTETQARLQEVEAFLETSQDELGGTSSKLREVEEFLSTQTAGYREAEIRERDAQVLVERSEARRREMEDRARDLEQLLKDSTARSSGMEVQFLALAEEHEIRSAEARACIARGEAERLEAVARLHEMHAQLADSDARLREAETQRIEAQTRLEGSESQLAQTTTKLLEFQELLKNSNAYIAELEAEQQELHAALERNEAELRELQVRLERSNSLFKESEAQLREAFEISARSEAQAAQLNDLKDLLRKSSARGEHAEAELRETQALLERRESERLLAVALLRELEDLLAKRDGQFREAEARQVEATLRLQEAEDRWNMLERTFRAKFEAVPHMLWTANPLGAVDLFSKAWREFTGDGAAEDWLEYVHPDDQARVRQVWNEALAHPEGFRVEHLLRRRDGSYHSVLTLAEPVRANEGTILGWVGHCSDLQQVVPTQRALAAANAQLEQALSEWSSSLEFAREPTLAPREQPEDEERAETVALDWPERRVLLAPEGTEHLPSANLAADRRDSENPATSNSQGKSASSSPTTSPGQSDRRVATLLREDPDLDGLMDRLRSKGLRHALARWRAARGVLTVPRFDGWEVAPSDVFGYMTIQVDKAGTPVRVLDARPLGYTPLIRALSTPPGDEGHGWQRCAATGQPLHDHAQVTLGPQESHSCERLLLPFSTASGRVDRMALLIATEGAA